MAYLENLILNHLIFALKNLHLNSFKISMKRYLNLLLITIIFYFIKMNNANKNQIQKY